MGWRDLQADMDSGAVSFKQNRSAIDKFAEGFVPSYIKATDARNRLKIDAEKSRLKAEDAAITAAKEKGVEEERRMKAAIDLAAQIFPEYGSEKFAVQYVLGQINAYEGNVGQAAERLESLTNDERLKVIPSTYTDASIPTISQETNALFAQHESPNGVDSLFGGLDTTLFKSTPVSQMSLGKVLEFTSARGAGSYHAASKSELVGTDTYAARNGLGTTPVGKYQFVGDTLDLMKGRGAFKDLGIDENTIFNEETQDKLYIWLMNDEIKRAGKDPAARRAAIRGQFEGFQRKDKNTGLYLVSDGQIDSVIEEIETGTFSAAKSTIGRIDTQPIVQRMDWEGKLKNVDTKEDWNNLRAEIDLRVSQGKLSLTESEQEIFNSYETKFDTAQSIEKQFVMDDYLKENPPTTSDKIEAAIITVESMPPERLRGDKKKQNLAFLSERLRKKLDKEAATLKAEALVDQDPLIFYAYNENGILNDFGGVPVTKTADGTWENPRGEVVDISSEKGWITTKDRDLSPSIKVFNKSIIDLSQSVESGYSAMNNMLQYRKYVTENPAVMNNYLMGFKNLSLEVQDIASAAFTAIEGGNTYEQFETQFVDNLTQLGNSGIVFQYQLRIAYDLAKFRESSGQALSDNELANQLIATGYGKNLKVALPMINGLISTALTDIDSVRRGLFTGVSGMLPTEFRRNLEQSPSGQDFEDFLVDRLLEDDEALIDQITMAKNKGTNVAQDEGGGGDTSETPTLEKYIKVLLVENKEWFDEQDPPMSDADRRKYITDLYNENYGGN